MNEVIRKPQSPVGAMAVGLFDTALMEPERTRKRLGKWLDYAMPPNSNGRPAFVRTRPGIEQAREFVDRAPSHNKLLAAGDSFLEAINCVADNGQTALIVATFLDGFPNARPSNPVVYLEAMTFVAIDEGFSAFVLAAAVMEIWRECRFPPTIEEFISKAKAVKARFELAARQLNHLMEMRLGAEDMLIEAGEMERPKLGGPWDED